MRVELINSMAANESITGENLHEDTFSDSIPGAIPFFKVDYQDDDYRPSDGFPSNPKDYLRSVMYEARNIPDVVVAKIDPSKIKAKKKSLVDSKYTEKQYNTHESLLPSLEWRKEQLKIFACAREEYIHHKATLKSISKQAKKRPKLPIYPLPPWNDEHGWKCLCFGNSLKNKNKQQTTNLTVPLLSDTSSKDTETDEGEDENDDSAVQDALVEASDTTVNILAKSIQEREGQVDDMQVDLENLETGFPPILRILLRMDASQIEANLEYHGEWLQEHGFSHEQGRWIYALLSCLDKPLYPTIISCLRDIARSCIEIRSKLDSPAEELMNGLNLIILIVGEYFEQSDLVDPV